MARPFPRPDFSPHAPTLPGKRCSGRIGTRCGWLTVMHVNDEAFVTDAWSARRYGPERNYGPGKL